MKLRICMVSGHACIRVWKEAYALKKLGHEVHHIAYKRSFGWDLYDTYNLYPFEECCKRRSPKLEALVEFYDKIGTDIFHVHNEPDFMVSAVRSKTNRPVIYDVHDLHSARNEYKPDDEEISAFKDATACVFPTETVRAKVFDLHGHKPSAILAPYVSKDFLCDPIDAYNRCPKTLVYEGGISSLDLHERSVDGNLYSCYRYYAGLVALFNTLHYTTHIFPASSDFDTNQYTRLGASIHDNLPWNELLRAMRVYELGLVGAPFSTEVMEISISNKLFEYISQGIVPVVFNSYEAAKFVTEYDLGIVIDANVKFSEQINSKIIAEKKANLLKIRDKIVMENYIDDSLMSLYRQVL